MEGQEKERSPDRRREFAGELSRECAQEKAKIGSSLRCRGGCEVREG